MSLLQTTALDRNNEQGHSKRQDLSASAVIQNAHEPAQKQRKTVKRSGFPNYLKNVVKLQLVVVQDRRTIGSND